jgi:hypothetical protein
VLPVIAAIALHGRRVAREISEPCPLLDLLLCKGEGAAMVILVEGS